MANTQTPYSLSRVEFAELLTAMGIKNADKLDLDKLQKKAETLHTLLEDLNQPEDSTNKVRLKRILEAAQEGNGIVITAPLDPNDCAVPEEKATEEPNSKQEKQALTPKKAKPEEKNGQAKKFKPPKVKQEKQALAPKKVKPPKVKQEKQAPMPNKAKPPKVKPEEKNGQAKKEGKKLGCIDAAVQVLKGRKNPMSTRELFDTITERDLWHPRSSTHPAQTFGTTLYEELRKGDTSRLKLVEKGMFAANS